MNITIPSVTNTYDMLIQQFPKNKYGVWELWAPLTYNVNTFLPSGNAILEVVEGEYAILEVVEGEYADVVEYACSLPKFAASSNNVGTINERDLAVRKIGPDPERKKLREESARLKFELEEIQTKLLKIQQQLR